MGCRDTISLTYTKVKGHNFLFYNKEYFVVFEAK